MKAKIKAPKAIKCLSMSFSDALQGSIAAAGLAAAMAVATTGSAHADTTDSASATEYRWEVDMRGKPPYKRERVAVDTVDIASMEIVDADVATEVVWQREFTGRPPFSRKRVELPIVDAASMELIDDSSSTTSFRSRPKRHR